MRLAAPGAVEAVAATLGEALSRPESCMKCVCFHRKPSGEQFCSERGEGLGACDGRD